MANPKKSASLMADGSGKPLFTDQQATIADAKVDYADDGSADDLDTDAKRVAAANATNGKVNSIIAVLEAHGLIADA